MLCLGERYLDYNPNSDFMSLIQSSMSQVQSNTQGYFFSNTVTIIVIFNLRCGYLEKRTCSRFFFFFYHVMKAQQYFFIKQSAQSFVTLISLFLPLKCRLLITILKGNASRKDSLWRWLSLLARQLNLTVKAVKRRVVCFY